MFDDLIGNGKDVHFGTKLVHAGHNSKEWTYNDVVPPISISTIFNSPSPGVLKVNFFLYNNNYNSNPYIYF